MLDMNREEWKPRTYLLLFVVVAVAVVVSVPDKRSPFRKSRARATRERAREDPEAGFNRHGVNRVYGSGPQCLNKC